jgi:cellulose synthase operon protein C
MPRPLRHRLWRRLSFAAVVFLNICSAAQAEEAAAPVKDVEQYIAQGNLKAAKIELKKAIRQSPQDPVMRAWLARVYLQLGDAAAAESEARAARERGGNEGDYFPILADALLRQYKFADVLELIQPGDRDAALESKVRAALGTAAAGLGHQDKAAALLREAVRLDPTAVKPKVQLAQLLNATDPAAADKLIDEAVAADPHSAETLQISGEMLRTRGDLDGAMHLFDRALQIDPKNLLALLGRADIAITRGEFTAADEILDPILQATPDNFMASYLRASELIGRQQYAAADETLGHVSTKFPLFPAGYYLQGTTKLALGQFAQAEQALQRYLNNVSDDRRAIWLIAIAALQQHGARRAIEYLKLPLDKLPADATTLTLLGDAYMTDRKPEIALRQFEAAAVLEPENPKIKTSMAIAKIESGQTEQGLAQLEQLFASEAAATAAGPTLVLRELRAKRAERAVKVAASLVEREPGNPLYLTLLGEVRAAQQDYVGAEAAFRAATAHDPRFMLATRALARLYLATERTDLAKQVLTDLLSKTPDDPSNPPSRKASDVIAFIGLADIAITEKKWAEAIDYLNRARTIAKYDPIAGLKLVGLFELRADWDSAKAVAVELGQQFPQDADVAVVQGRPTSKPATAGVR